MTEKFLGLPAVMHRTIVKEYGHFSRIMSQKKILEKDDERVAFYRFNFDEIAFHTLFS
jgi:hypothetical protein